MEKLRKNGKYKNSISRQFALVFIGVMAITLIMCWIGNNLLLESYYMHVKMNNLKSAYSNLNDASKDEVVDYVEINDLIEGLSERYSLDIIVLNTDTLNAIYTGKDPSILRLVLWDHLFAHNTDENNQNEDGGMPVAPPNDINVKGEKKEVLLSTEEYEICISKDMVKGGEYLDMWGNLDNGDMFVMRSVIESINESVDTANRFIGYIGILEIFIAGILIVMVSKKVTSPILEIANISERITNLDFSARYVPAGDNEITLLGNNINELSDSLEKTIAEIKAANIELQKDIDEKNQIDEMRKEFLSNVSHELKTPIALIQGYAEGLIEGIYDDPDSMKYYCEVINDEAQRMNRVVQKLLTLNQLEFSTEAVTLERFDISELINNCVATTEILASQNGINITIPDNTPIYVWGDEYKTEEVLINYLSNAINHCENEKEIKISLEVYADKVRTIVYNSGKNIPDECIDHIWEKFYKVDKARTREYGGSGIGLSIVAAICKSMNQEYGVDNLDGGVAFWFELDRH